jgi:hypothetical protein
MDKPNWKDAPDWATHLVYHDAWYWAIILTNGNITASKKIECDAEPPVIPYVEVRHD